MTFNQIEYFLAIIENKNFSITAKKLYISQPALSNQINAMEQELGVKLFLRDTHTVTLTEAGEVLYRYFSELLELYETALSEARLAGKSYGKNISIGYHVNMKVRAVDRAFDTFFQDFPNILRIERDSYQGLRKSFENNSIDVLLTLGFDYKENPKLQAEKITSAKNFVALSWSNPLVSLETLQMKDFSESTFLIPSAEEFPFGLEYLTGLCKKYGFKPKNLLYVNNMSSMFDMIKVTDAVAVLDMFYFYESKQIEDFKIVYLEDKMPLMAVWKKDNLNPHISHFIEIIKRVGKSLEE